ILATDLIQSLLTRMNEPEAEYQVLGTCLGAKLEHLILNHPFYERQVPVILGEHVTIETGTGAVHTAPAHGIEDYVAGKKYNLPVENPVGDDGCFTAATPLF